MEDGLGTWARHPVVAGWVAALTFASRELSLPSSWLPQSSSGVWVTGNPAGRHVGRAGAGGQADAPQVVTGCTWRCTGQAGQLGYSRQKSFWAGSHLGSW